jgi:hypothetical protein
VRPGIGIVSIAPPGSNYTGVNYGVKDPGDNGPLPNLYYVTKGRGPQFVASITKLRKEFFLRVRAMCGGNCRQWVQFALGGWDGIRDAPMLLAQRFQEVQPVEPQRRQPQNGETLRSRSASEGGFGGGGVPPVASVRQAATSPP